MLLAEGHDVEMFSPDDRSAAHRSGRTEGPLFCLRLAWLSRRFDAVVVHFEQGLPLRARAGRWWRAVTLTLFAAALRMFHERTVRFDADSPIPGGIGSRAMGEIWTAASHVVVASEQDRTQLIAIWGLPEERVTVAEERPERRVQLSRGMGRRRCRGSADRGARGRAGPVRARPRGAQRPASRSAVRSAPRRDRPSQVTAVARPIPKPSCAGRSRSVTVSSRGSPRRTGPDRSVQAPGRGR